MDYQDPQPIQSVKRARRMVESAYRASRIEDDVRKLTEEYPELDEVNLRLASYLSMRVNHPHTSRPLFYVCVLDALTAAESCGKGASRAMKLGAYLETLADRTSLILRYEIQDDNGIWDPLHGVPLATWFSLAKNFTMNTHPGPSRRLIPPYLFKEVILKRIAPEIFHAPAKTDVANKAG